MTTSSKEDIRQKTDRAQPSLLPNATLDNKLGQFVMLGSNLKIDNFSPNIQSNKKSKNDTDNDQVIKLDAIYLKTKSENGGYLETFTTEPVANSSSSGSQKKDYEIGRLKRVRYFVALLGLAIAVVNCYAQATFCIAIVEMVLPADFVFKGESGQAAVVKVASKGDIQQQHLTTAFISGHDDTVALKDHSCPVEYRYRDYYDSWRFAATATTANETQQPTIPLTGSDTNVIDMSNRFDWDASRQGLLLGAFAIGTAPLQVLCGRLAEIYGAKWVLLTGCVGTALTNLTIPFLAHFSFALLIVNRVLMGVAQAGMEPGLMCLLSQWLTPAETGFFISMLLFAICIGFFLGSLGSSFLLTLGYSWSVTYYVAGGMNLLVAIVWFLYASSRPSESKLVTSDELKYIEHEQQVSQRRPQENTNNHRDLMDEGEEEETDEEEDLKLSISSSTATITEPTVAAKRKIHQPNLTLNGTKDYSIPVATADSSGGRHLPDEQPQKRVCAQAPWMNILSTPSVWAFIICKISIRWCADVLSIELPSYLANVLHLSIKLNGILNSVSSALFAIFSFITGYLVNEITKNNNNNSEIDLENHISNHNLFRLQISKTNLRKLFQSVASFGAAITVFLMTRYDCNILLSMSMLLLLSCCLVMGTGGELQIPYDMTSRYPGTLHGMACTLSVSGWLAPPLIGLILGDQPSSRYRWNIVWYMTALINLIGGLVFVLFADASPRDFDQERPARMRRQGKLVEKDNNQIRHHHNDRQTHSLRPFAHQRHCRHPAPSGNDFTSAHVFNNVREPTLVSQMCRCCPSPSIQDENDKRGRHLTGYCNLACGQSKSSSNNSPPTVQTHGATGHTRLANEHEVSHLHYSCHARGGGGAEEEEHSKEKQNKERTQVERSRGHTGDTSEGRSYREGAQAESWLPRFDREPIRVRQVEESLVGASCYLSSAHLLDSVAANETPIMFPYRAVAREPNRGQEVRKNSAPGTRSAVTGNTRGADLVWRRLWAGSRHNSDAAQGLKERKANKFSHEVEELESGAKIGRTFSAKPLVVARTMVEKAECCGDRTRKSVQDNGNGVASAKFTRTRGAQSGPLADGRGERCRLPSCLACCARPAGKSQSGDKKQPGHQLDELGVKKYFLLPASERSSCSNQQLAASTSSDSTTTPMVGCQSGAKAAPEAADEASSAALVAPVAMATMETMTQQHSSQQQQQPPKTITHL